MNTLHDHKIILTYTHEKQDILFNYINGIFQSLDINVSTHIDDDGTKELTYLIPTSQRKTVDSYIDNILDEAYIKHIDLKSELFTRTYSATIEIPTENILDNITLYQKNLIQALSKYSITSFRPIPSEKGYAFALQFPFNEHYTAIIQDIEIQTVLDLNHKAIVILDWNDILENISYSLEEKNKIIFK